MFLHPAEAEIFLVVGFTVDELDHGTEIVNRSGSQVHCGGVFPHNGKGQPAPSLDYILEHTRRNTRFPGKIPVRKRTDLPFLKRAILFEQQPVIGIIEDIELRTDLFIHIRVI